MTRKQIVKTVGDLFKRINKLSRKIIKTWDADDIHVFRVQVKKLRAFLRLLNSVNKTENPLIPEPLKTFYRYIGYIRNIQLHCDKFIEQHATYKAHPPVAYMKMIGDEKRYWQSAAADLITGHGFRDSEEEILENLPDKVGRSTKKRFLEKKTDKLKKALRKPEDDKTIHTVRKILKDLLYAWKFIDVHRLPESISKQSDLKSLTSQIGDFIDKQVQLEFLSDRYLENIKDEQEKKSLLKMKAQLLNEKQTMLRALLLVFRHISGKL